MIDTGRIGKGPMKSPAPIEKKVSVIATISPEEVERILREYARSLNLRGYPADEETVTIEIGDSRWMKTNTYLGPVHLRFDEV
jgi:hypothetical protein